MIKTIPNITDQIGPRKDAAKNGTPTALRISASPTIINTPPTIFIKSPDNILSDYHIYYCCATGIGCCGFAAICCGFAPGAAGPLGFAPGAAGVPSGEGAG